MTSTSNTAGQCATDDTGTSLSSKQHVQDDFINNDFNSTVESSKDFDAAGGSIFEEDNVDECSHVSEQVCDVVYVFHNVSLHCLFCSILTHMLHTCNILFHFSIIVLCFYNFACTRS